MKLTDHEVISRLKQFASDLGHIPSRQEFRDQCDTLTEHMIRISNFNTFAVAMKACGFEPGPRMTCHPASKFQKEQDKHEEKRVIAEAFEQQIMSYVGKYEKPHKNIMTMVSGSDFHSIWSDPFCLATFIDVCRRVQPDVIGLVGDVFDFYAVSRFNKDPSRLLKLQSEIDYIITKIFQPLREACPNSQIDLFIGNHEWRLFHYLATQGQGISSLRCLQFDQLFQLEKFQINLVAKKSFLNTKKEKDMENYKIYGGVYVLTHGTSLSQFHAAAELKKYGKSGCSGHVHHYQVQSTRDLDGEKVWTTMGCMCRLEAGDEYISDLTRWNQGFEVAHIDVERRAVIKEYVHISDGFATFGGIYYTSEQFRKKVS